MSYCPYGHDHCRGRGFCGYERWGWRRRKRLGRARGGVCAWPIVLVSTLPQREGRRNAD